MSKGDSKRNGRSNKKKNKESSIPEPETSVRGYSPHIERLYQKYREIADPSIMVKEEDQVSLGWEGLSYTQTVVKKKGCKVVEKNKKYILNDVTGFAAPGRLLAIMGPSGAGKTSLLNVLARNIDKRHVEGSITLNGQKLSKKMLNACSGFVAQDDILLGSATPYELLFFNAKMKLPDNTDEEIHNLVMALLRSLGLEAVKDSLLGYTGQHALNSGIMRGVSGGERKRVSICYELISNPKLLFLDEPTSGLDSFAAKAVVESLRSLAFTGRTIITTIHQPSAEMFQLFDDLCIIAEGKVVYFGPADYAVQHFASMGYEALPHTNLADYFIRILRSSAQKSDDNEEDVEAATTFSSTTSKGQVKKLIKGYKKSDLKEEVAKKIDEAENNPKEVSTKSKRAGIGTQITQLTKRTVRSLVREPMLLRMRFFQSLFMAIFGGLIWLRQGTSQEAVSDRVSAAFFMFNSNMIAGLNGPSNIFPPERSFFFRERKTNTYSTAIYYLSKVIFEIPFILLISFVTNTIFYFMVGFDDSASTWIVFMLVIMLIGFAGHATGMFIASAVLDMRLATTVLQPLLMMPLMLFSGFFLNSDDVPKYFIWAEYASFMKYAFRAGINTIFSKYREFDCTPGEICRFPDSDAVKKFYNTDGYKVWVDCLAILAIGVCFHILAFLFLYIRGRKPK